MMATSIESESTRVGLQGSVLQAPPDGCPGCLARNNYPVRSVVTDAGIRGEYHCPACGLDWSCNWRCRGRPMSLSKRTRYEVLRRCGFACFYCGQTAPNVVLEVDHVIPRSRGGGDEQWNLVAACVACNNGKLAAVPLASDIDRARSEWVAYCAAHGTKWVVCAVCGRPISSEEQWYETGYTDRCEPCYEEWFENYTPSNIRNSSAWSYEEMLCSVVDGMRPEPFGPPAWYSDLHPRPLVEV